MSALAHGGRCDPDLIAAARGGDADALVSLIAAAQPDVSALRRAQLPRG